MIILLAAQLIVMCAAFALVWRRLDRIADELTHVRGLVENMDLSRAAATRTRARAQPALATAGGVTARGHEPVHEDDEAPTPASRRWSPDATKDVEDDHPLLPIDEDDVEEPPRWRGFFARENLGRAALALLTAAPLAALPFGATPATATAIGFALAAILVLAALRPVWRDAAWVGALAGGAWAAFGFTTEAASAAPALFSAAAAIAGVAGLAYARLRRVSAPGVALSAFVGAATLMLGAQIGMIGPAGIAFGLVAALAAALGATALRIEALHLAAFAATGLGLFVLSAQPSAAIWFTPAAMWGGALFAGIAFVRAPEMGERGVTVAGTGVAAPLFAVAALYVSQHGLANPLAAAGAFAAFGALFAAMIVRGARLKKDLAGLGLTLPVLAGGVVLAAIAATWIAVPAPLAAALTATYALCLFGLDAAFPARAWRVLGVAAAALAAIPAWSAMQSFVSASPLWPRWGLIAVGLVLPPLIAGAASLVAKHRDAPNAAGLLEFFAFAGALTASSAILRYTLSGGAPDFIPVGFLEAGVHITLWFAAGLALAAYARMGAAAVVTTVALVAFAMASLLWLTPYWLIRAPTGLPFELMQHAPLGFALIAAPLWGHWAFWRRRGAALRTRASFGAAGFAAASFAALELIELRRALGFGTEWMALAAGLVLVALALGAALTPLARARKVAA